MKRCVLFLPRVVLFLDRFFMQILMRKHANWLMMRQQALLKVAKQATLFVIVPATATGLMTQ
jgi:hypothetical protein